MDTIYWIVTVCVFLYALISNLWVNDEIKHRKRLENRLEKLDKALERDSTKVHLTLKLVLRALWMENSIAYTLKEMDEEEKKEDTEFINNIKKLGGN